MEDDNKNKSKRIKGKPRRTFRKTWPKGSMKYMPKTPLNFKQDYRMKEGVIKGKNGKWLVRVKPKGGNGQPTTWKQTENFDEAWNIYNNWYKERNLEPPIKRDE